MSGVLTVCYFLKPLRILYISIVRIKKKNISSAVDLRYITELLGTEVLDNLNSAKNMLKKQLFMIFVPMKFKEILTAKHCEGLYLIRA
jgi:hypothetical protein